MAEQADALPDTHSDGVAATTPVPAPTGSDAPEAAAQPTPHDRHQQTRPAAALPRLFRHLELVAAILLAIASVATAWCAYQSSRWSGVQAIALAEASTLRLQATNQMNVTLTAVSADLALYIEWLDATADDNTPLATFLHDDLMRPEFRAYFEQWLAQHPDIDATITGDTRALPAEFDIDTYVQRLMAAPQQLLNDAERRFDDATRANQNSDDYVLSTVLFAAVLFFAGMSSKLTQPPVQTSLVGMSLLMLLFGIVRIAGLPVH